MGTKRLIGLAAALASVALAAASTAAGGGNAPVFYVALGDSLATGAQPAPSGAENRLLAANGTNRGYVDVLHAAMRERIPNLQLRDFGCGGETTTSLIDGGLPPDVRCGYERGSQLAEAVAFLRDHSGEIAFVTIDIGANDVFAGGGVPAIAANLPVILGALRAAAGQAVPIVGMNYYDPFVAPVWFATHDPAALQAEVASTVAFNDYLEGIYAAFGMVVADVEAAFAVSDSTIQPDGLPLNVQRACAWTWICSVGDIHATDPGYAAIARSFLEVLQP